jgi:hypothetical protein
MISKEELYNQLGAPARYPLEMRQAVARLVAHPIEDGVSLDDLYERIHGDLALLLDKWLNGDPEYPVVDALVVTQLAHDFVRFALTTREVARILSDEALPILTQVVDVVELAGVRTGDWSWCASVADFLYAVAIRADQQNDTPPPAN